MAKNSAFCQKISFWTKIRSRTALYFRANTDTGYALNEIYKDIFELQRQENLLSNNTTNRDQIVLVLTDGLSDDEIDESIEKLHSLSNINVIAVGVGNFDKSELLKISTESDHGDEDGDDGDDEEGHVLQVDGFDDLHDIYLEITEEICAHHAD